MNLPAEVVRFSIELRGTGLAGRTVDFDDVFGGEHWHAIDSPLPHPDIRGAHCGEIFLQLTPQQFVAMTTSPGDELLKRAVGYLKALATYAGKAQIAELNYSWHCHMLEGDDTVEQLRSSLQSGLAGLFTKSNDLPIEVKTTVELKQGRTETLEIYVAPRKSTGTHANMVVADIRHSGKYQASHLSQPAKAAVRESRAIANRLKVLTEAISKSNTKP